MKTLLCVILIFSVSVFFNSCSWGPYALKQIGDTVTIIDSTRTISAELIEVQDSVLLIGLNIMQDDISQKQQKKEIASIELSKVNCIKIEGYQNRNWFKTLITFQFVPSILMGVASAKHSGNFAPGFIIFAIPTAITYLALEASTPSKPKYEQPFTSQKLMELRKYARYPNLLSPSQRKQLIESYEQPERQIKH